MGSFLLFMNFLTGLCLCHIFQVFCGTYQLFFISCPSLSYAIALNIELSFKACCKPSCFTIPTDDNDTSKNINGRKGDNFTFPASINRRSNSMILVWSFSTSEKELPSVIAQLYKDDAEILPVDQFRNRFK